MKTAQEAAREYSGCKYAGTDLCNYSPGLTCDPADCYAFKRFNAFLAGVRWAEEWISVKDELPRNPTECRALVAEIKFNDKTAQR